jgi:hypothetical protein
MGNMKQCRLVERDGVLAFYTPYSPGLVAELKTRIPSAGRTWDKLAKCWMVAPEFGKVCVELADAYCGEQLVIPQVTTNTTKTCVETLKVIYLGRCKDQGGTSMATAFLEGENKWGALFPEEVLRAWFSSAPRPGEATTLYGILGVDRKASVDEIRKAYRRLALQWHPDVCKEPDAAEMFKSCKRAFDTLSDPDQRTRYDVGLLFAGAERKTLDRQDSSGSFGYRTPLRCGMVRCEGAERLGRFVVSKILAWDDIVNEVGQTMVSSWPYGATEPEVCYV